MYRIKSLYDNTMDYYNNKDNEGHIFAKITNDGKEGKKISIKKGDAFMQGIISQYFITEDDDSMKERVGGIGSTSK